MGGRGRTIGLGLAVLLAGLVLGACGDRPSGDGRHERADLPPRPAASVPRPAQATDPLGPTGLALAPPGDVWQLDGPAQYRFRPLGERERQRLGQGAGVPDHAYPEAPLPWGPQGPNRGPHRGSFQGQPGPAPEPDPGPGRSDGWPGYAGQGPEEPGYSFRPFDPARAARRWQGPYSTPSSPISPGPDIWTPGEPPSQWGSMPPDWTPPARRMYPALDPAPNRNFSAR